MSHMEEEQQNLDDMYEQTCSRSPKSKKIKKCESLSPRKNIGHWTKDEHDKYLEFLDDHAHMKKNNKIFKPMSEVIGTRSPSQCRSHHQKFNPMSPLLQRKVMRTLKTSEQTIASQQEETNVEIEEENKNHNMIKLMFYDEDDYPQPLQDFNLDDYI